MIASRSPIVAISVRVVSPLALMLAGYLFFAGHNQPGGGFAAGLVIGSVIALRMLAGMQPPADAVALLSIGAALCAGLALYAMFGDDALLDQIVVETTLPLLGKVKTGYALIFDLGVTLIVAGLIIAVLQGLGAVTGGLGDSADSGAGPEEVVS